jgi:hypothetical protein
MSGLLLHLRASKKAFFEDRQGGGQARLDRSFFPLSIETRPTGARRRFSQDNRSPSHDIIGFAAIVP